LLLRASSAEILKLGSYSNIGSKNSYISFASRGSNFYLINNYSIEYFPNLRSYKKIYELLMCFNWKSFLNRSLVYLPYYNNFLGISPKVSIISAKWSSSSPAPLANITQKVTLFGFKQIIRGEQLENHASQRPNINIILILNV